jgi:tetratricopeptide (TPR) repeat protein
MTTLVMTWLLLAATAQAADEAIDARQVDWQRTLDDALALRRDGRPLLIAVNMDGESASDRIVVERYRDPAFVAATRHCVCLAASVFRHNRRDHDDAGRRIPCPRFGNITCGEHLALEPLLFDAFLSDGDRVAPRHALVLADGKKLFDLSLCFDLKEVDRTLVAALARLPVATAGDGAGTATPDGGESWSRLAARRDAHGRAALEAAIAEARDEATLAEALRAIATQGDAGSLDALRLVAARLPALPSATISALVATARALPLAGALSDVVLVQFQSLSLEPLAATRRDTTALLPLLATLGGESAPVRSLLLGCAAFDSSYDRFREGAGPLQRALAVAFGSGMEGSLANGFEGGGGRTDLDLVLKHARAVTQKEQGALPKRGRISDAMDESEALARRRDELQARLDAAPDDPATAALFAKCSLDLGRRRLEEGAVEEATRLLDAAEAHWQRALAARPDVADDWIERARTAYFRGRADEEVDCGRRALALLANAPPSADGDLIEAKRWIADGLARRLGETTGDDPSADAAALAEALRHLTEIAASEWGDVGDWLALASLCDMHGLARESFAIANEAARRFPADRDLRQQLNGALWIAGRIDLAPAVAQAIERDLPAGVDEAAAKSAASFTAYASLLAAEDARRSEEPERALAAYDDADRDFARAGADRAWSASCWLGRGMACARVGQRAAAAETLVAAATTGAPLGEMRDGLDCDVLDLVDRIFEWRESGPSGVDPLALLERLDGFAPDVPLFAVAIGDALLREALRSDGRNPDRVMRDTVDAADRPIRMELGRPTEEGDAQLLASLAVLRRAKARLASDADRHALAQSDVIWAERMQERSRDDGVREALTEAAELQSVGTPPRDAPAAAWSELAAKLRSLLGPARPRQRPGR